MSSLGKSSLAVALAFILALGVVWMFFGAPGQPGRAPPGHSADDGVAGQSMAAEPATESGAPVANQPVASPPAPKAEPERVAPLASFVAHDRAGTFVLFTSDGERLISGGSDNLIEVWEMRTGGQERTLFGHSYGVKCGALSPDGTLLVTGSWDQTLRVWEVGSDLSQKPLRGHTAAVDAIALAPDGKMMASGGGDHTFRLWNLESRDTVFTSPVQDLPVNRLTISPDGTLLATGTGSVSEWKRAGELKLWEAATGTELAVLPGHSACINAVVFSPDGRRLATGTADGMLRVWDVALRDEILATKLGSGVRAITFFEDGETLVIGQWPGRVFLWDLSTRKTGPVYAGHEKPDAMVDSVALSPDQSLIASTGTDGMIYLWPVPESTSDGKRQLWKTPAEGKQIAAEVVRHWKTVVPEGTTGARKTATN